MLGRILYNLYFDCKHVRYVTCDLINEFNKIMHIQYNTIQYNCLFRAPIAKNKSYSKALYIVQCTVTTILLSVVNLKKMSFQFRFE